MFKASFRVLVLCIFPFSRPQTEVIGVSSLVAARSNCKRSNSVFYFYCLREVHHDVTRPRLALPALAQTQPSPCPRLRLCCLALKKNLAKFGNIHAQCGQYIESFPRLHPGQDAGRARALERGAQRSRRCCGGSRGLGVSGRAVPSARRRRPRASRAAPRSSPAPPPASASPDRPSNSMFSANDCSKIQNLSPKKLYQVVSIER